jgi:phosphoglycolate phosphatase-like HAD superfamily hydrolase
MSFATYGQQLEVPDSLLNEFVRRCLQKVAQKETPPALFEGMGPVIERLAAEHVIAVVTGNSHANVSAFLAHHGLSERVRSIYGVDAPGSKVEKIRRAKGQFACAGEAAWMVGDSVSDVQAAREARVASVAVAWGHQSAEKLSKAGPDFLVHSPGELLEVIESSKP